MILNHFGTILDREKVFTYCFTKNPTTMEDVSKIALLNLSASRAAVDYLRGYFKNICEKNGIEMTSEMIDFHFQFANFVRFLDMFGFCENDQEKLVFGLDNLIEEASLNNFASLVLRSCIERNIVNNTLNEEGLSEIFSLYARYVASGCYEKIEVTDEEMESELEAFFAELENMNSVD